MQTIILSEKEIKQLPIVKEGKENVRMFSPTEVIKTLDPLYQKYPQFQIERKYDLSERFEEIPELVLPKKKVKNQHQELLGAIYDYCPYPSLNDCQEEENLNLQHYLTRYQKLEDILKRCSKNNIIIPDFNSADNILVTKDSYRLIDYEDMQIEDCPTPVYSSLIPFHLIRKKKYYQNLLYTEEFSKMSIISLFLIDALEFNFAQFYELFTMIPYASQQTLELFGITECESLRKKIIKLLSPKTPNEWLEDTLEELKNYTIIRDEQEQCRRLKKK